MEKENCLKIISTMLTCVQKNPIILIYPPIWEKIIELLDKSCFGSIEAEITLIMMNDGPMGKIMLSNWMEVASDLGNMASSCLSDFGHVALETKAKEDSMSVTIYFSPE